MPMYDIQPRDPGLPRLGKIRLGERNPEKKNKPEDRHYFVLRDAPKVAEVYPVEPVELLLYLPFATVDQNAPNWHKLWKGSAVHCQGDARHVTERFSPQDGFTKVVRDGIVALPYTEDDEREYQPGQTVHCPGLNHLYPRCKDCVPETTLRFMVRDPKRINDRGVADQIVANEWGLYEVVTRSFHNNKSILGSLMYAADTAEKLWHKDLRGIPMILRREPQKILTPVFSQERQRWERVRTTKHLLVIKMDLQWMQAMSAAMYANALVAPAEVLQITAGEAPETEEDIPIVEGEFVDDDDEPVVEGDHLLEPLPGKRDFNWLYKSADEVLEYPIGEVKRRLGAEFHTTMNPEQAWHGLVEQYLYEHPELQPGAPQQSSFLEE